MILYTSLHSEQLLSIQHDTEDIASHVTDGVLFLNKLLQPEGNQSIASYCMLLHSR